MPSKLTFSKSRVLQPSAEPGTPRKSREIACGVHHQSVEEHPQSKLDGNLIDSRPRGGVLTA